MLNDFILVALTGYVNLIKECPEEALATVGITANWKGGVNNEIITRPKKIGSIK